MLVHKVFLGYGVSADFVAETVIVRVVVGRINFSRLLAWIEEREKLRKRRELRAKEENKVENGRLKMSSQKR